MVGGVKSFFPLNSRGLLKVSRPIKNNYNSGITAFNNRICGQAIYKKEKGLEVSSFKVKHEYNDYNYIVRHP